MSQSNCVYTFGMGKLKLSINNNLQNSKHMDKDFYFIELCKGPVAQRINLLTPAFKVHINMYEVSGSILGQAAWYLKVR